MIFTRKNGGHEIEWSVLGMLGENLLPSFTMRSNQQLLLFSSDHEKKPLKKMKSYIRLTDKLPM